MFSLQVQSFLSWFPFSLCQQRTHHVETRRGEEKNIFCSNYKNILWKQSKNFSETIFCWGGDIGLWSPQHGPVRAEEGCCLWWLQTWRWDNTTLLGGNTINSQPRTILNKTVLFSSGSAELQWNAAEEISSLHHWQWQGSGGRNAGDVIQDQQTQGDKYFMIFMLKNSETFLHRTRQTFFPRLTLASINWCFQIIKIR